jgi:hypothetical protein
MATAVLVDLRNIYRAEEMQRRGFAYVSVGKPDQSVGATSHLGNSAITLGQKVETARSAKSLSAGR